MSKEKRKGDDDFYGRFLTRTAITMPTTMIATNKPAIAGTKYMSATDWSGCGEGVGVAAAGSTAIAVSLKDA